MKVRRKDIGKKKRVSQRQDNREKLGVKVAKIYICVCVRMFVCICTYMCVGIYMTTSICVYMCRYMCACRYTCIYVCEYIYVYMYIQRIEMKKKQAMKERRSAV